MHSKHTWQSWAAEGRWHCSLYSPELLASGKTEASLRLYCSVRLATLYKLPLVEKPKPSAWPDPKTATSHGELLFPPHELLSGSTVAESGRENCAALWGKDPQRETMADANFSSFPPDLSKRFLFYKPCHWRCCMWWRKMPRDRL